MTIRKKTRRCDFCSLYNISAENQQSPFVLIYRYQPAKYTWSSCCYPRNEPKQNNKKKTFLAMLKKKPWICLFIQIQHVILIKSFNPQIKKCAFCSCTFEFIVSGENEAERQNKNSFLTRLNCCHWCRFCFFCTPDFWTLADLVLSMSWSFTVFYFMCWSLSVCVAMLSHCYLLSCVLCRWLCAT